MINGEGPTSPDPFDSKNNGGGDVSPGSLSRYSSCGGESEFERYCSANSLMGTPSFCGSASLGPLNDRIETEFGSLKSLDNFSLGGELNFDRNFERKLSKDGVRRNGDSELELYDNEMLHIGGESSSRIDGNTMDDSDRGSFNARNDDGKDSDFDEGELKMEDEEDGISSRCEHSGDDDDDDDDSMYGFGSDDENMQRYYTRNNVQEMKNKNENLLIMNLSAALGLDDWDDFELETAGGALSSLTLDNFQQQKEQVVETRTEAENKRHILNSKLEASVGLPVVGNAGMEPQGIVDNEESDLVRHFNNDGSISSQILELEQVEDIPASVSQVQGTHELENDGGIVSIEQKEKEDISVTRNAVQGANEMTKHSKNCSDLDLFGMEVDHFEEINAMGLESNILDYSMERESPFVKNGEMICSDVCKTLESRETGNSKLELAPLSDTTNQICPPSIEYVDNESVGLIGDSELNSSPLLLENSRKKISKGPPKSINLFEDRPAPSKAEKVELDGFYDEIVNEMEEILLDSSESPGARFPQGNNILHKQLSSPLRDGGSTASTSGTDDNFPLIAQPRRIDEVEVVGAKQKKGDVSLSERLVGVKEYTVYRIRVWAGKDQWEVERRYRDFFTLYRRLKSLFTDQGWTLPLPWPSVEKESRKIFGNASPDVVSERSVLIQECLRSVIHSGYFISPPSALFWFLCSQDSVPSSPASQKSLSRSVFSNRHPESGNIFNLGKTISLLVEIRPYKSMKQLLEAQHYTCAGCHKHFDDGMTLVQDLVQALGWGKPRLCEYTGQLFCSSCHTNDSAVLPARVLHFWDFTPYPVSQLAKSYLDSIYEQPMLCVSAVNPFLFSKVPTLQHIMNVRKKIGTMVSLVRCPFRRTINKGLGSRRYLLESNDFFALKDLIDLSKGAFAALPMMLETVLRKITEHITDQCLICCDVGVPCCARQACDDPSSLIFPFQEGEIEKCTSCESVFHKPCYRKLTNCSCGAVIGENKANRAANKLSRKASDLLGRSSSSVLSVGLMSGLFSKAKSEKTMDDKDHNTVILMGSLPSTTL